MFDRILLFLLILLLPAGILASRLITGELKIGSNLSSIQEKKIEVLVDKLNQQVSKTEAPRSAILVTATVYSSESATLKVSGLAPQPQAFLWVWTASSKSKKEKKVASGSASLTSPMWSGPVVLVPHDGGSFTAEIDVSEMAGIAEVRLEQGSSITNVRYDLDKQKELQ